jgi:hypothetical protein
MQIENRRPCKLRYEHVADGPGPAEQIVQVRTASGETEEIVITQAAAQLDVGLIEIEPTRALVELPAETARGHWRIWVRIEDTDLPRLTIVR